MYVCIPTPPTHHPQHPKQGITKLLTGGAFSLRANLAVGYLSEVVHLPLTVPLEVSIMYIFVYVSIRLCMRMDRCPEINQSIHPPHTQHIYTQVVITRLITSKGRLTSFVQAFQEAVKEGGLPSLYKGITAYVRRCMYVRAYMCMCIEPTIPHIPTNSHTHIFVHNNPAGALPQARHPVYGLRAASQGHPRPPHTPQRGRAHQEPDGGAGTYMNNIYVCVLHISPTTTTTHSPPQNPNKKTQHNNPKTHN
jgi:hypothetical protein